MPRLDKTESATLSGSRHQSLKHENNLLSHFPPILLVKPSSNQEERLKDEPPEHQSTKCPDSNTRVTDKRRLIGVSSRSLRFGFQQRHQPMDSREVSLEAAWILTIKQGTRQCTPVRFVRSAGRKESTDTGTCVSDLRGNSRDLFYRPFEYGP